MKPNKYDLVLFDMDGTLINSDPMLLETFHILYDLYNNGKQKEDKELPTVKSSISLVLQLEKH